MTPEELQDRSLVFGAELSKLCHLLRADPAKRRIADQLLDCASSVGANYRSACRGRSRAEFIAKLGVVVEEIDESVYWLEFLVRSEMIAEAAIVAHLSEARQLRAIFARSYATSRSNDRLETARRPEAVRPKKRR